MARLAAAFGTSHSVMLAARLEDWLNGFRVSDQRMPFFDLQGEKHSYAEMLAKAPPERAAQLASNETITRNFNATQEAMERLKGDIQGAKLDVLVIVGDDQHELFQDQHMPSMAVYYGETIRNAARNSGAKKPAPEAWYTLAQSQRLEEDGEV